MKLPSKEEMRPLDPLVFSLLTKVNKAKLRLYNRNQELASSPGAGCPVATSVHGMPSFQHLTAQSPDCRLFDRDWRIVVRPHPIAAFRCDSSIVLVVLSLPANEWALRTTFGPEHQG